jgi:hypothetical protein
MIQTTKAARFAVQTQTAAGETATRTPSEVSSMLLDIATVLRLTAMVKAEMIRDRVEADRQVIDSRRTNRLADLPTVSA